MPKLHGVNLSPFVRKVRVALAEKGIEYESIPVFPFGQTEEFKAISPLGKIPVYEEDGWTMPDSSVIIDYLERKQPSPPLYPSDPRQRARALFLEEYADTKLVELLGTIFFQRFVNPKFMQQDTDQAIVDEALNEKIPPVFDYLESQVGGGDGVVDGRFGIADIAITSPFVNFFITGERIDAARWPKLADYVARVHGRPHYKGIVEGDLGLS